MSEELEERVQRAVEYFMKGYGCGQSVVAAFADLYGMDEATAFKVGNGFGGGVGKMRMMCGAVSGLVILAGMEIGQTSDLWTGAGPAGESIRRNKTECYKLVQNLLEKFRLANGSIICAELLGLSSESSDARGEHGVSLDPSVATGEHGLSTASATGEHGQQHGLKSGPGDFTPSERNSAYYKSRPCAAKVESAARIFAEYLSSK